MAQRPVTSSSCVAAAPSFAQLNRVSQGAKVLFATDDFFAPAECLFKDSDPEWKEGVFDSAGKWMDGWETRRKRIGGHDWALIRLQWPSEIHGVHFSTAYFTGNFTPIVSLQAARLSEEDEKVLLPRIGGNDKAASQEEIVAAEKLRSHEWEEIVTHTKLGEGYSDTCVTYVSVANRKPWTHLRLNYFPDGGVARLRIYGQVIRSLKEIRSDVSLSSEDGLYNLVGMNVGGVCLSYSDAHYGHPRNMILPTPCPNIGNGWETARRMDRPAVITESKEGFIQSPGSEWATFKLGLKGRVARVEVDTTCFKGNFPDSCIVEFLTSQDEKAYKSQGEIDSSSSWRVLVPKKKLLGNQSNIFEVSESLKDEIVSRVRLTIAPDGGVARLKLWGKPVE